MGADAWEKCLKKTQGQVANYLECDCNIGRNITQIKLTLPEAKPSIIEISEPVFRFVTAHHDFANAYHGPILNMDQHKNRQYWTEIEPRAWKFSGLSDFHKEIEGKMPAQALKMFKAEDSLESEKRASYISVNKGFP